MTLTPYLGVLGTPLAFVLELVGVAYLLFCATRLEHAREADETPRIIRPWSEPEKPKRHWFWIKIGVASAVVSGLSALVVFSMLRHAPAPSVAKQGADTKVDRSPKAASPKLNLPL